MRLLSALAVAAALVDVSAPGTYVERYEVRRIPHARMCLSVPCASLVYVVNYGVPSCLAPIRASVLHRGEIVPIKIDEVGTPGKTGYRWTLSTTRLFTGPAAVVIEIGDICHDKA